MTILASRYRRQTEHAPRCAGTPFFFFLRQSHVVHNTRRAVISSPEGCFGQVLVFRQVLLSFDRCCWSFVRCCWCCLSFARCCWSFVRCCCLSSGVVVFRQVLLVFREVLLVFRQVLSFVRCCRSFVGCRSQDLFNAELSPER